MAHFIDLGTSALFNERLTTFVITGRISDLHCFNKNVGNGSYSQVALFDFVIIKSISNARAGLKLLNVGTTDCPSI